MTSARRLWLASLRQAPVDWRWWTPVAALAAVVYPPLLLSGSGRVVADTHAGLSLDPGGLLTRAAAAWDPTVGLGTVTQSEHLLLWPTAPFYWVANQLSIPAWVTQRVWLGTLILLAGGGVMFLARTWRWRPTAAAASAFAYSLSPFLLTLATRSSVSLLPFAGLPWLLALAVRATRSRGWRHPALFALVIGTVGPGEPAALVLLGAVPLAWIFYARLSMERVSRTRATSTVAKITLLSVTVNLWWIAGTSVQVTNGLDMVRYGEPASVAAAASSAPEVLRGLGYWGFYDGSRLGPSLDASVSYTQQLWLLAATFALPALGLLGLGVVRWRHRSFVVGLAIVAVVIAVGAHPWSNPSPIGVAIRSFLETDAGAGLATLTWMVPALVLATAIGIGSLVGAIAEDLPPMSAVAAAVVAIVAFVAVPPLWRAELVPDTASRPSDLPRYWHDTADHLNERGEEQAGGSDTVFTASRVLELPGVERATYPWGYTSEPVLPALLDRGHVIRRLLPQGSAAASDLLRALDRRLADGTLEPEAVIPIARLMGVGDVVVRNEGGPDAVAVPAIDDDLVPFARQAFGDTAGVPFGDGALWVFEVPDPRPLVEAVDAHSEVLISGSADGLIDAAAAGLIDGTELIRYSASVTDQPRFVTEHLTGDRALIITDSNRARAQRWDRISDAEGFTEQGDAGLLRDDPEDHRLPLFDGRAGTETVADQRALSVRATGYGSHDRYDLSVRPAHAADGDPTTAWVVGSDGPVIGHRLELRASLPVTTDAITLQQAGAEDANRWITKVELSFDGSDPLVVTLDHTSRRAGGGQVVDIGLRTFGTLSIEITGDSVGSRARYEGLDGVGFADVGIVDLAVDELIRMPSDLLDGGGFRTLRYPLAIVQTRSRSTSGAGDLPEEATIARAVRLPTERSYQLRGTARLSGEAAGDVREALLASRAADDPDVLDTGCRDDLLSVGGDAVEVRITANAHAASLGAQLDVEGCQPVTIPGGDHDFRAADGAATGIDLDQLVWCSAGGGLPCQPNTVFGTTRDAESQLVATITGSDHTTVKVEVTGTTPDEPFWLVLGQSFDSGWEIVDSEVDAVPVQLVNGYANGYLITSPTETATLTVRFTPQNRVEIAFLLSLIAAAAALLLSVTPSRPLYPVPISQMEPLRRVRAFSWEGALPTKRDAIVLGAASGAATAVLVSPFYGLVVGTLAGLATRREGWRPAFTVLPGALLAACGMYIFAIQFRNDILPGLAWVQDTARFHSLALAAVILLGIDVVIERTWIRDSEYQ